MFTLPVKAGCFPLRICCQEVLHRHSPHRLYMQTHYCGYITKYSSLRLKSELHGVKLNQLALGSVKGSICNIFNRRLYITSQHAFWLTSNSLACTYNKQYNLKPATTAVRLKQWRYFSSDDKDNQVSNHVSSNKKTVEEVLERENVLTVPNLLTMTRIVLTPFLGYLVLQEQFALATGIFLVAGITDLLDGYIARNFKNQTSAFGSFLDPLADKLLVSVLYVSLTVVHLIPLSLAVLVIARDVLLIAAAFYVRYISLPPPRTLSRYFNATKVSAELKPLFISKLNTALQLLLIATSLTAPVFDFINHPALHFLWFATASTTVASGVGYMFAKGTFKELRKKTL